MLARPEAEIQSLLLHCLVSAIVRRIHCLAAIGLAPQEASRCSHGLRILRLKSEVSTARANLHALRGFPVLSQAQKLAQGQVHTRHRYWRNRYEVQSQQRK